MLNLSFIYFSIILLFGTICLNADEHNHKYDKEETVYVWATGIGPFDNNQEIYKYSILSLCPSEERPDHKHETLGENLLGKNMELTSIKIKFLDNIDSEKFCSKSAQELAKDELAIDKLGKFIQHKYQIHYEIDGLELKSKLGEFKENTENTENTETTEQALIYTHYNFEFKYNKNQIISVELEPSSPKDLVFDVAKKGLELTFSTKWTETETPFENRLDLYFEKFKSEHKFRWFSIINSFLLVIFLVGVVLTILFKTLHKDFARYDQLDNMDSLERDFIDDYGWKQIHGDVFRPPRYALLLSSILGSGLQLLSMALIVIIYVLANKLYLKEEKIISGAIFFYCLSAISGGIYSGNAYTKLGGRNYLISAVLTAALFPVPVGFLTFTSNVIALFAYNSRVLTFFNFFIIFITWFLMSVPLTYIGSLIGRHFAKYDEIPCRVHAIPRPIPPKPWYLENYFLILATGILPFGSIFIELHTILNSFWGYKPYYLYGFLLLSFLVLIIVTGCISIVGTYLLLNMEDYRWHWLSIGIGSSSVLYIYLYSMYYFYFKTEMYGIYQVTFYFFNTFLGGLALGLALGMVGYYASYRFVRKLFSSVKID